MNYWAIWVPCGVTILITGIGWLFTVAKTAGRIENQEITLNEHHETLKSHGVKIEDLGTRMTAAEAFRLGYEAGRNNQR